MVGGSCGLSLPADLLGRHGERKGAKNKYLKLDIFMGATM